MPYQVPQPPQPQSSTRKQRGARLGIWAVALAGLLTVATACGRSVNSDTASSVTTSSAARSAATAGAATATSPSPAASCALPDDRDLIERDDLPGVQILANEIGEVDLGNCVTTLSEFQQTAGQGQGECTTIAWASDNPGYDADAIPAPPLKKVIESAGPGC